MISRCCLALAAVVALGLSCKAEPPETRGPAATPTPRPHDAGGGERELPGGDPPELAATDADGGEQTMTSDQERVEAARRMVAIRQKVDDWAGPDASVMTWPGPAIEGLAFFSVERPRAGGPRKKDPPARTIVWIEERDEPLEGAAAMRAVLERTRDPKLLSHAALLVLLGGGEVAERDKVPAALRDRIEPPVLEEGKLTFWGRVPAARGLRLARVELDLETMKLETNPPRGD